MHPGLIVICGPTAVGKSGLAIKLAQRMETVILNADSRACYREFDIGTAKPTLAERAQIPHYLLDICDPTETLTLADYQQQAQTLIAQLQTSSATAVPLLVGGTGLYLRSITQGLSIPRIPPQAALRSQLQALGQVQLYAFLQQVDPIATQRIHAHDQVRTLRALEVYYTTGRSLSEQQTGQPPTYPILQIGMSCEPTILNHRIERRTAGMIEAGLVAEVETLCHKYGPDLPLLETLGYREIRQYLAGGLSLHGAQTQIVVHTRQLAKRQRTWFRADPTILWFDPEQSDVLEQIWTRVQEFLACLPSGGQASDPASL
ncbi:tRNA (adenosine(37)-N6)-dimethylallyltransferase MiaA [Leptolyngbya sp. 'hensonii']|uniref:tRNA (adenosine(37)-N6)-dimethylallyltransferase MiaA n=1 Tax=Leptolyngbya sp. 'hensonii' TaxID=1922337 RepID=UPI00095000BD|nr:tRNA (adenosine(37)-N6)-dimethylallyltransferase MiaA [Leptolyngbya sp. 'hensonii']OLP17078.1 tRNA (adenosine(37)-N6)-dimethylallyltransferase MiaA [Leptolyngbya sp. 'hensonii']